MPDRSRIGRNSKSRSKEYEREVARILGGTRYLADTGGPSDVQTPIFEVQVKSRASVPEYLGTGLDAARSVAVGNGKLGLLVVVQRGRPGVKNRYFVVADLHEFAAWEGAGDVGGRGEADSDAESGGLGAGDLQGRGLRNPQPDTHAQTAEG